MDCISVTPRLHRDELDKCVNRPVCLLLQYESYKPDDAFIPGKVLQSLMRICRTLDLTVNQESAVNLSRLGPSFSSDEHLRQFLTKAVYLQETLGAWSAEYFIIETVKLLRDSVLARKDRILDVATDVKCSILKCLEHLQLDGLTHDDFNTNVISLSSKAQCLANFLAQQPPGQTTCIVFVQRRVMTAAVCHLLSRHPMTRGKFRCAPFVGSSNNLTRTSPFDELVDLTAQKDTLPAFRSGQINLLVATNALEEGIDVQSCNLVVCFDPPLNLKSFIQRRGRARQEKSTLAIMASKEDDAWKVENWQAMEAELIRICQRDRVAAQAQEPDPESEDESVDFKLYHPKTK